MTREVQQDFDLLVEFARNYELSPLLEKESYRLPLKQGHAAYLALLTLWSEIQHRCNNGKLIIAGQALKESDTEFSQIREAISDFGSSLFCCMQGAYKPGHMSLRSAIENYVRALAGLFNEQAASTTSVYDLFDLAKQTPPFKTIDGKCALAKLKGIYAELCKFSHSATLAHMAQIRSLEHFPSVDEKAFADWAAHAKDTTSALISSFIASTQPVYTGCHFKTRDIIDMFIAQDQRTRLLGGT